MAEEKYDDFVGLELKEDFYNSDRSATKSPCASKAGFSMIGLDQLVPRERQPRTQFNEDSLEELKRSILSNGIICPILVRPVNNHFEIIAGERRYRAAVLAGNQEEMPCIVKDISDDQQVFILSLIENLQREDLSPFDEATAYQRLVDDYGMTQQEIGTIIGKNQSKISEIIAVNRLPETIREKYPTSDISKSHLIEIAKAPTREAMEDLAERVVKDKLTVKQTTEAKNESKHKKDPGRPRNSGLFSSLMSMAKSYAKVLSKLKAADVGSLSDSEKKSIRAKILENREIEDAWLEMLGDAD